MTGGRFEYQGACIKVDCCCCCCCYWSCWSCLSCGSPSMDVPLFRSWSSVPGHWLSFVSLANWDIGLQLHLSTSGDPVIQGVLSGWFWSFQGLFAFTAQCQHRSEVEEQSLFISGWRSLCAALSEFLVLWRQTVFHSLWTVRGSYSPNTALEELMTPTWVWMVVLSRVGCTMSWWHVLRSDMF